MIRSQTEHPTSQQLEAFGLGMLERHEQDWVEQHVAQCVSCCQIVAAVPDDTLLGRLKSCDTSVVDGAAPSNIAADTAIIPSELEEHPRYRIVAQLGKGGMGEVFHAEHRLMQRSVAVKVINRRLLNNSQAIERFKLEVRSAARLAHPHIVMAFDAEQAGPIHLLVMEYVDGVNLADHVLHCGPLPIPQACEIARQAALGLQHAHEQGMVHRDIKPHNLMLTRNNQVKILDFGLARFASEAADSSQPLDASLTAGGTMLGTPDYAAPEQIIDARSADIRADLYSLGGTLYFLLTGSPPFPGGTAVDKISGHLRRTPASLATVRSVPPGLSAIVDRLLQKEPSDRYQTPAEVASALLPYCGPMTTAEPSTAASRQPISLTPSRFTPDELAQTVIPDGKTPLELPAGIEAVTDRSQVRSRQSARRRIVFTAAIATGLLMTTALAIYLLPTTSTPTARVLIVIPYRNFWGPDYYEVRERLDKANVAIDVASSQSGQATPSTLESPQDYAKVPVERTLSQVDPARYDAVIFTGAHPYTDLEFVHDKQSAAAANTLIRQFSDRGKYVTSICVGNAVLVKSGILRGQEVAWNEFLPTDLASQAGVRQNWDHPTIKTGSIITARKHADAEAFTKTLLSALQINPEPGGEAEKRTTQ